MLKNTLTCILFVLLLTVTSCELGDKSYPEQVFEKVALNGNKIPAGFKRHFNEIRAQLKAGNLKIVTADNKVKNVNASEYVENHYIHMFDKDIEVLNQLKPDEETGQILKDGLEMFQYAQEIYRTDFPRIAKMIDDDMSNLEIDAAIEELDMTKGVTLAQKFNKVYDQIIPYANKHGVAYKTLEMPSPINYK